MFALIQTDVHTQAQAYIRTYVRNDGQTDRCTGANMSNDQLLCELKKYQSTENKKILLLYDSQEHCVFFYLNRQCRPRCRLVQGLLLIFFDYV